MRNVRVAVVFTLLFILLVSPVYVAAEDITPSPITTHQNGLIQYRQEMKQAIQQNQQQIRDTIHNDKEEWMKKPHDLLESIKEKREALKAEFQHKREEFRTHLQTIRDEKKKAVVERIDSRLSTINTNRTQQMTEVLQKLDKILDNVSSKASELKTKGVDVSAVETAIDSAQTAINTAKDAVSTQAAKEYIAEINDENTLGQTISTVVTKEKADLNATHQAVVDARKAVKNAATELAKVKHEANQPKNTESQ